MALRIYAVQSMVVIGLVAGLEAPASARDDDPRDFRRNDSRYESRRDSDRNDSQNGWRYNDPSRNDDQRRKDDDDERERVAICHRFDSEDDDDDNRRFGAKTVSVFRSGVAAHQRHGDTLGPCPVSAHR
jgi:hypothetical protein